MSAHKKRFVFSLSQEEHTWLSNLATARGITMADWLRQTIRKATNKPTLLKEEAGPRKSDDPMGYTG